MPVHGRAGGFVRRRFERNLKIVVGYIGGYVLLVLVASALFPQYLTWWWIFPVVLIGLVVHRDEFLKVLTPWLKGARGEEAMGRLLKALDADGYFIINDREMKRGNVDHVVVGPTGVFAIETKAWTGRMSIGPGGVLRCGGADRSRAVRQAQAEAMAVRDRMRQAGVEAWVEPIIALTATALPKGWMRFGSVTVMEATDVVGFIRSKPKRLKDDQIPAAAAGALLGKGATVIRVLDDEPPVDPTRGPENPTAQ